MLDLRIPDWLLGIAILVAAIALSIAVHQIGDAVVRRAGARAPFLQRLAVRTRGPALIALVVLFVTLFTPSLPFSAPAIGNLEKGLLLALVVLVGWIALLAVDAAASVYLLRFSSTDAVISRKHTTQVRVLRRAAETLIVIITVAAGLMIFESVRQLGLSLFASAGIVGLVVGFAARPVLGNLIAGVQIAISQPIRIDDSIFLENEWGTIEEITGTFVVVRLWDQRRLIVPLTYFLERPFQNWSREGGEILIGVKLFIPYHVEIEPLRREFEALIDKSPHWDRKIGQLEVLEAKEGGIELRALMSAKTPADARALRASVGEEMVRRVQAHRAAA